MSLKSILTYGFAIFAMFFGSGNLVFPLQIGFASESHWLAGFFGLLLTGILLPFLGLFVIKIHKGNYYRFFSEAGGFAGIALPFFTLSLLGSFGVVPRCITVAHGGLSYLFPEISLFLFSAIFCVVTFLLCLKDQVMITIVGKWMSPILLLSLFGLIIFGLIKAPTPQMGTGIFHAFSFGFLTGYQTMDLFAAFFFSALIFKQIQNALPSTYSHRQILKYAIIPSIIGSIMLALVYLGFVFLGSSFRNHIAHESPETMLPAIATIVMGEYATIVIAIAMVFSCLTTAVALNNIYARYLCTSAKLHENKFQLVLVATTAASFVISLLDFKGIARLLAPALDVSYPGLIALTFSSIFLPNHHRFKMYSFWAITMVMFIYLLVKTFV
jgi:LIVCS family branched-chain amino acid:cation transporter